MLAKNGFKIVTNIPKKEHDIYVRGYTKDLLVDSGIVDGVHSYFIPIGLYKIGDTYLVPKDNIFLQNKKLTQPGIIVTSKPMTQKATLNIRTQNFFTVTQSNIDSIKIGNVIITRPFTSHRFDFEGEERFYIQPQNIALNIRSAILPGPDFMLLKTRAQKMDFFAEREIEGRGWTASGKEMYFTKRAFDINIKGDYYAVVKQSDIYAEGGKGDYRG